MLSRVLEPYLESHFHADSYTYHKGRNAHQAIKKVQGWVSYFGKYAGSSMHSIYAHINRRLVKWCKWKYRKFKRQAIGWLKQKWQEKPMLFVHWQQSV